MAYTKDKAIELSRSFLKQALKKHPIHSAYLFGSYARGIQSDYSDIDIAIIIRKIVQPQKYQEEAFEIFHEAQEYNSLLEVLCFREDEFKRDGGTIVAKIKKEGIRIKLGPRTGSDLV